MMRPATWMKPRPWKPALDVSTARPTVLTAAKELGGNPGPHGPDSKGRSIGYADRMQGNGRLFRSITKKISLMNWSDPDRRGEWTGAPPPEGNSMTRHSE